MEWHLHLVITCFLLGFTQRIFCVEEGEEQCINVTDVGEPLILTKYLKNGNIETAKNLSKVVMNGWSGYSGYFTVNEECGGNLFFWYIPAKNNSAVAPVYVWLQGGPGASSMYGQFVEVGPIGHTASGYVMKNYTWNINHNMLYIDQPIGTGFSFPKNSCLAENMTVITQQLYSVMIQFYTLFPEMQANKLYLTGESFAGHYIPALAVYILTENEKPSAAININLEGILIGNTLTRLACHNYSYFLWELGMVGVDLRDEINAYQRKMEIHIENGENLKANDDWYYILNSLIGEKTKMWNRENVAVDIDDMSDYMTWLNSTEAHCLLHVGDVVFTDQNWDAYNKLKADIPKSFAQDVETVLKANKSTGFYSGNLDMICLTTSTDCLLRGLNWWGAEGFLNANRTPWFYNQSLAGWSQWYGPLYFIVVKDSGHSVPKYKPAQLYEVIGKIDLAMESGSNPAEYLNKTEPE